MEQPSGRAEIRALVDGVLVSMDVVQRITRIEERQEAQISLMGEVREELRARPRLNPAYCDSQDGRIGRLERWRYLLTGAALALQTELIVVLSLIAAHVFTVHP